MTIKCLYDELIDPKSLKNHPKNRNKHGQDQIKQIAEILKYQGWRKAITVSNRSGCITAGHGRKLSAIYMGLKEVPVVYQDYDSEEQEYADIIADNAIASWAVLDFAGINSDLGDLGPDFNIDMLGIKDFCIEPADKYSDGIKGSMSQIFLAPPFSVLDSKQEYWKNRKNEWNSIGFKSDKGRGENLLNHKDSIMNEISGTSIFDPVLAEISYHWFCPNSGSIIDPFSGGSTRGIVASKNGYKYTGIDLRIEQVSENEKQIENLSLDAKYICDDSLNMLNHIENESFDFCFTCPPYFDLEVYSDDPCDLSNMDGKDFIGVYSKIIKNCYKVLKQNTFAAIVIGEVRDKNGNYLNFVGETIKAYLDAGFSYYNEIVYLTPIGTLPLRAGKIMKTSRKVGKTHQNLLVFVKGDGRKAAELCGTIEMLETCDE